MQKVLLTKDVTLNKLPTNSGSTGIVIVQQDSVGGHIVQLPAEDIGFVDVALNPGGITELHWRVDDEKVYWNTVQLTAEVIIHPPKAIDTLVLEIVDTVSAKIRWKAPQGFEGNDNAAASLYYLIISSSFITSTDYPAIKLSNLPKLPGEDESIIVPDLAPNTRYYFAIYAEKTAFGKVKKSLVSNVITVLTSNLTGTPNVPKRIPFYKDKIYEPVIGIGFRAGQLFTDYPSFKRMANQDAVIDDNGTPVGTPSDRLASFHTWGGQGIDWYNNSDFKVIFELDGTYNLDYCYINFPANNMFRVYTSGDGVNLALANQTEAYNFGWRKVNLATGTKSNVRFIYLAFGRGSGDVYGFLAYGTKINPTPLKGEKYKRVGNQRTIPNAVGTNVFPVEQQFNWVGQVSSIARLYTVADWIMGGNWKNTGYGIGKTIDQIQLSANTLVNYDVKLQELLNTGQKELLLTLTNGPQAFRTGNESDKPWQDKPVDPSKNGYSLAVTTDPQSYRFMARVFASLAYRFGFNQDADEVCNQYPDNVKAQGLVRYYEIGNEIEKSWDGSRGYYSPEEFACYLSACYDGHKGALGAGCGIKVADPNAKVVMPGLIHIKYDFIKACMLWWDVNRGIGDYPLDVINFHFYNGYQAQPDTPLYSSIAAYAVPPEQGLLIPETLEMVRLRDLHIQNAEVWCTEFGYTEQHGGYYSPRDYDRYLRGRHKGIWIVRSILVYLHLGLDAMNHYWYGGDTINVDDLPENQPSQQNTITRELFYTSGVVDGVAGPGDRNRKPLQAFWYLTAFRAAMQGFSYSHTVMAGGVLNILETDIIIDSNPNLWIIAVTNETTGKKCLILWLGVDNWTSTTIHVRVNNTVVSTKQTDFNLQDVRANSVGVDTLLMPTAVGGQKRVTLEVGETPIIIETDLVGTELLKAPVDIVTEAVSPTSIKLVWTDKNIGLNKTRVYVSTNPTTNFNLVEEEYRDTAETTIANLLPNTQYYFRLQFILGDKLSVTSDTVNKRTLLSLATVDNLVQNISSASTVQIGWTYSAQNEATIDGFVIYRSQSDNGVFTEVGRVSKAFRSFRDIGLVASTGYYYKVQAYKDSSVSAFSFVVAATTVAPSYTPPEIQSAITDTAGGTISLFFDELLQDEQTAINAFTISERLLNGTIVYHPLTGISTQQGDSSQVILKYAVQIFKNSTITVSYSGSTGQLKSIYGNPVNSFTSYPVTNITAIQMTRVLEWTEVFGMTVNGNSLLGTRQGTCAAKAKILAGEPFLLQFNFEQENCMIIGLDSQAGAESFNSMEYFTRKYLGKQEWKKTVAGVGTSGLSQDPIASGLMRFRGDGTNIYYENSVDGGIIWTTIQTTPQPNHDLYIKVYCEGLGQKLTNVVGYNIESSTVIIEPNAPTDLVIDDENNLVSFTPNPAYPLSQHEYSTNYQAFIPSWASVPSNPISIGDVNIYAGNFAIRVKEATDRSASDALVSTVDMLGSINSNSKIMIQKANGGQVLAGFNTLTETKDWLASATISQDIIVQFNTSDTYAVPAGFDPRFNNGTNWVMFQGAAGVRPILDAQNAHRSVMYFSQHYMGVRNMEFRNAICDASDGAILRGWDRHHIKVLDVIVDRGHCAARFTPTSDQYTSPPTNPAPIGWVAQFIPNLITHHLEVDNVIIRNVVNGAFRCNGAQDFMDANISYRNIFVDDVTNGGTIPGATWNAGKFSAPMVLKNSNGIILENYRGLDPFYVSKDAGELEACSNVVSKSVIAHLFKWRSCKGLLIENCYIDWVGGTQVELTDCEDYSILHSFINYANTSNSKNPIKIKGNVFKMAELDSMSFAVDTPSTPWEESDNIFVAGSNYKDRYLAIGYKDGTPTLEVKPSNLTAYKATGKGNNSVFLTYFDRDLVNLNPWGSLRGNSAGKAMITGVIEGISEDILGNDRVYPTDPGPWNGLQVDVNDTPTPPSVTGDNTTRILVALHPKYASSEIVYSINDGAFQPYLGIINVGDAAVTAGYYKFKIKAAVYRNESTLVNSPAFDVAVAPDPDYAVLQTVDVNFSNTSCSYGATNAFNTPSKVMTALINRAAVSTAWGIQTGTPFQEGGCTIASAGSIGDYIIEGGFVQSGMRATNPPANPQLILSGLDDTKFYQFYIIAVSNDLNSGIKITCNGVSISKVTTGNYPYTANGDMYANPAVIRFYNNVPIDGEIIIEFEKEGTAWPVALNYLIIEESNIAKPV